MKTEKKKEEKGKKTNRGTVDHKAWQLHELASFRTKTSEKLSTTQEGERSR